MQMSVDLTKLKNKTNPTVKIRDFTNLPNSSRYSNVEEYIIRACAINANRCTDEERIDLIREALKEFKKEINK